MDKQTIAELAYQNGYERGLKDAVKHGRWEQQQNGKWVCSNCKTQAAWKFRDDSLHIGMWVQDRTAYCPFCGAKMD